MKIKDLENKLPCRVKITSGFTLEESIDPGFVVDIVQIKAEDKYGEDWCYKIWFNIPPELIPICTKVSKSDWRDDSGNYSWNYFEAKKRLDKNGTYQDTAYVMDCDDWFEFYEEPKSEYIAVKALKDDDGHWYIIPEDFYGTWLQIISDLEKVEEHSDEYYSLQDEFNSHFEKYRTEGDLNLKQLYIKNLK